MCDEKLIEPGLPLFKKHYRTHLADHSTAFPGVGEVLTELGELGEAVTICINKRESPAIRLVEAIRDSDFCRDTLSISKPGAEPLLEAIARAGGAPAAFVDDSITDADIARAAGIPCVALIFGSRDRPTKALGASRASAGPISSKDRARMAGRRADDA